MCAQYFEVLVHSRCSKAHSRNSYHNVTWSSFVAANILCHHCCCCCSCCSVYLVFGLLCAKGTFFADPSIRCSLCFLCFDRHLLFSLGKIFSMILLKIFSVLFDLCFPPSSILFYLLLPQPP